MNLLSRMRSAIKTKNDKGQDLLEYALLVALIAVFCVTAVRATGTSVNGIFASITEDLFQGGGAPAGGEPAE